jgi:hypothetical protein
VGHAGPCPRAIIQTRRFEMSHAGRATKPKYGEKMIEVKIRFWTDEISNQEGHIVPKHAWTSGVVRMERNDSHGIVPGSPRPFNSLMEIPAAIEKVLIEHNIKLRRIKRMGDYIE